NAGRARIAGDECRGGGRCLRHRLELSAPLRRDRRQLRYQRPPARHHRADVPARRIQQAQARQQGDRRIRSRRARLTVQEKSMEAAIDRIMQTYDLLANRSAAASAEARAKVTEYVTTLFEAGEKDTHRLTVCGLTYLRELDGSTDPVKAGYTGL